MTDERESAEAGARKLAHRVMQLEAQVAELERENNTRYQNQIILEEQNAALVEQLAQTGMLATDMFESIAEQAATDNHGSIATVIYELKVCAKMCQERSEQALEGAKD